MTKVAIVICPHCGRDKRRAVIGRRGEVPCYWCGLLPSADYSALLPPEVRAALDRMKADETATRVPVAVSPGLDGTRGHDPQPTVCPNCGRSKKSDLIGHRHTGMQCYWCGHREGIDEVGK